MQINSAALTANSDLVTKKLGTKMRNRLQSNGGWLLCNSKETVAKELYTLMGKTGYWSSHTVSLSDLGSLHTYLVWGVLICQKMYRNYRNLSYFLSMSRGINFFSFFQKKIIQQQYKHTFLKNVNIITNETSFFHVTSHMHGSNIVALILCRNI